MNSGDTLPNSAGFASGGPAPQFNRGSARMFDNALLEKLSHVHPMTPLVLYVPIVLASLYASLVVYGNPPIALLWQLPLGYVLWTLLEYWLHRLLFHLPVRGKISERIYFFVHGVHHDWPWDTSRLVLPPAASIALATGFYFLYRVLFDPALAHALFAALIAGYVAYDTLHWYSHVGTPKNAYLKWLRREHMIHHFKEQKSRFGVSCPWWDHVFRTTGR